MSEQEIEAEKRRRGYWLRLARRQAGPGGGVMNQAEVADAIGLSKNSGSTISNWEAGRGEGPSAQQLLQLARLYRVPPAWFFEPRPTDEERLRSLAGGAADAALQDEEAEAEDPDLGADDEPSASLDTP
jgi:transcriptional regulator with XRE-family HTH domain